MDIYFVVFGCWIESCYHGYDILVVACDWSISPLRTIRVLTIVSKQAVTAAVPIQVLDAEKSFLRLLKLFLC